MTIKTVPGPSFLKLMTHFFDIRRNFVDPLQQFFDLYGDVYKIPLGGSSLYVFRTPDAAKEILQEKVKSFKRSYELLKPLIGDGVLTSEGEKWKKQRKMLAPLFHQKSIDHFYSVILDESSQLCQQWENHPEDKILVDPWMMKITLSIIGRAMISSDISENSEKIGRYVTDAMDVIGRKAKSLMNVPIYIPSPDNFKFKKAIKGIDLLLNETIQNRRKKELEGKDMLDLLLGMQEEQTGETFSNPEIRDNLNTMILAGHESTATALSWSLYLLAKHPEIQEKLYQEIKKSVGERAPQIADLYQLKFLNQIFKEVLRLYPPFWYLERKTVEEVEIDGYKIPKNQRVVIPPYFVHRNPEVWKNPNEFQPERFEDEQIANRHKMAWIPFGSGPRYCMGQPLASLEILVIIFKLVRKFRFELITEHPVEFNPTISLRARHGILVKKILR